MAEHLEGTGKNGESGPTYKSLFIGSCAILGATFGWWFTGFVSNYDIINKVWEQRISALEIRDTESKWTFRIHSEKITAIEERLRQLEYEHRHVEGHKKPETNKP